MSRLPSPLAANNPAMVANNSTIQMASTQHPLARMIARGSRQEFRPIQESFDKVIHMEIIPQ